MCRYVDDVTAPAAKKQKADPKAAKKSEAKPPSATDSKA
jgi:hypothetical protein